MRVRQSVPSFGALHLAVGMNFSVPETTDIWSADKTALVPFITELTVRYTTRVCALTGTQGCVRERDFRANHSVALAHCQGLSGWTDWGGGGCRCRCAFLSRSATHTRANQTQKASVRMYVSPAAPDPSNSTVALVESDDGSVFLTDGRLLAVQDLTLEVGSSITLEATVRDRFGIVVVRSALCCCWDPYCMP